MSERLPRSTHPAEIARLAADREAGARAARSIAPAAPTVADRAAKLSVAKPPVERGPRGRLGPSGGGPSIEAIRASICRTPDDPDTYLRALEREADQWPATGAGGPGPKGKGGNRVAKKRKDDAPALFGDDAGAGPGDGPYGRRPANSLALPDPGMVPAVATGGPEDAARRREETRAAVAALASEVMRPKLRELERLDAAVRRAIELLARGECDPMAGGAAVAGHLALAILRECLLPEGAAAGMPATGEVDT